MPTLSRRLALACCLTACSIATAATELPSAPPGAEVYFISPTHGEHFAGKFVVRFGLRGMGVAPAGVDLPGTGHHHLLINADPLPDLTQALPASAQVMHFGQGQTETELDLPPGTYTLQLVLGNALHIPFSPGVMSGTIKVTVKPE